jgi:putative ABC transport system permease protein
VLVAVLTLAIGIGGNSAIFSAIYAVLLRPLPYPDPDRVVFIREKRAVSGLPNSVSPLNYLDWQSQNSGFDAMAAIAFGASTIAPRDIPMQVRGMRVSADYFAVFGLRPMLGRALVPSDTEPGADHVAILSHRLWASQFGSDRTIVGRAVRVGGEPYTVVGVMPASASVDFFGTELWTPLTWNATTLNRNFHSIGFVVARLKRGTSLTGARAQMDTIVATLEGQRYDLNDGIQAFERQPCRTHPQRSGVELLSRAPR